MCHHCLGLVTLTKFDNGQWVIDCLIKKARQISDLGRVIWKSPKWLLNHFKTKLLWFMNCERKIKRKRRKLMSVACTDVSSHVQCLVGQSKQRRVVKISMCFNTKENNATLSVEITSSWNARITGNIKILSQLDTLAGRLPVAAAVILAWNKQCANKNKNKNCAKQTKTQKQLECVQLRKGHWQLGQKKANYKASPLFQIVLTTLHKCSPESKIYPKSSAPSGLKLAFS